MKKTNSKEIEGTTVIDITPENIADYGVCGYKDAKKHLELRNKIDWFKEYYPKGLRIKVIISDEGGYQGMLEYMPGKYAYRPVDADGYMFIQCVFVGLKKDYKDRGYASLLIEKCIEEAESQKMLGVAVVTRKGSFMVKKDIFVKRGFTLVDKAKPDFELLVLKFDEKAENPKFKDMKKQLEKYKKGLYVFRSIQCPYTEKNVKSIIKTAKEKFDLKANLIDLNDAEAVQNSPCPFGSFCIIYNGEIISHHPISNKRFENIMNKK